MRKIQLDILRALAIFLVLGHHMPMKPLGAPAIVQSVLSAWQYVGWMGVDLFFVLSGFLISGLLFKEHAETGGFNLVRFFARRGLKIYPSYYVFLLLALPAVMWIPGLVTPYNLGCEAVFASNYFGAVWGHTWTLCIEEHFYIVLALGFFIVNKYKSPYKYFVPGCILLLALPLLMRFALIMQIPYYEKPHYTSTALRLDALTFGVLLSYYYFKHGEQLKSWMRGRALPAVILGLALLSPCALGGHKEFWFYTLGLTSLYMGWGVLLLLAMSYDVKTNNKGLLLLSKIGLFSYSIYLWHKPFSGLCSLPGAWWPGHPSDVALLFIYFVGSLGVGIIMSKCVEWPVLKLRDKLFPSPTQGTSVEHTKSEAV